MNKFRVGDEVQITSGRDRVKKGKVGRVLTRENMLVVSGVNLYKRHRKATRTQKAGIYEIERPLSMSKVALICPKCARPTRVGFKIDGKTKNRICKKCQGVI